jgi:hypothetical protein
MSELRKAAQQALIVLRCIEYDSCETVIDGPDKYMCDDAYEALRAALAQPEQEPVTWRYDYTRLPQRKPLTEEEIDLVCAPLGIAQMCPRHVARAIEKAHWIGVKHE